ncbi:MAG: VWA domain-containing protein [Leptospiraceae bacterium]|nr:VWA domain-containing protein [Leptospiraceae bacterium]MBK7055903.1 VWA domain-containing protein [Leptospiraceae bacterium]MBP9165680.1 VWA domain-containing protein [Leptospiraceae bacterium]
MELDQYLFKKSWGLLKRLIESKPSTQYLETVVRLEDYSSELTLLARALTGKPIEILPAEREGGCNGLLFFLPKEYSHTNSKRHNLDFYIFRVIYMSLQIQYEILQNVDNTRKSENPAYFLPFICSKMKEEFPGLGNFIDEVLERERQYQITHLKRVDLSYIHGKRILENTISGKKKNGLDEKDARIEKITSEIKASPVESIEIHEVDKKAISDYTLGHNFEKIETAEEFGGNWRDLDGSDDLQTLEDAIRELKLKDMVRVDDAVHSIIQSEMILNSNLQDSAELDSKAFYHEYPEWDFKKKTYKEKYCKVFPGNLRAVSASYSMKTISKYKPTLSKLKQKMNRISNQLETVRNESYGDEIDIDATVEYLADLISNQTPRENIYLSKRRRKREISVLVLIDLSLSTDSFVEGKRILDVERESTLLLGEILHEFGDRFQVNAFSSRTRNHCDYLTIKGFDENWNSAKHKIGALEPFGYTRIGPAIRHSLECIQKEKSKLKWILILSDGKPNDYDRYEGKYGIEDIKQSVKECKRAGVHLFALAIDKKAKDYLPMMLGLGGYRILPHPDDLPEALGDFYMQLLK